MTQDIPHRNHDLPHYKDVFPEYDDVIALPDGWDDVSWRNDVCPCFANVALKVFMFVENKDPANRDFPETNRYSLMVMDDDGCVGDALAFTAETFDEIIDHLVDYPSIEGRETSPAAARTPAEMVSVISDARNRVNDAHATAMARLFCFHTQITDVARRTVAESFGL